MNISLRIPVLTDREIQILELVARGLSAKEIGKTLGIAHRTVDASISTMRLKVRSRNKTHLVAIAMAMNLLPEAEAAWSQPPLAPEKASNESSDERDLGLPGWFVRLD